MGIGQVNSIEEKFISFVIRCALNKITKFYSTEWYDIYNSSRNQSIIGVSFACLQSLCIIDEDPEDVLGMSESLYDEWMSAAAVIQETNEKMLPRCAEVEDLLASVGFHSCIIKGQSLAPYYGELASFRQSGDIDVWVDASIEQLVGFLKAMRVKYDACAAHVSCDLFPDFKVELHPTPALLRCPWLNRRLQKWIRSFDICSFEVTNGFHIPPTEFNLVFLPVHILHHVLMEGIGLKQYMDYYYVLKSIDPEAYVADFRKVISSLHMTRFMRGVMWVMQEVFGLEKEHLLVEPEEKTGRFLLEEALAGGNFGKHDTRNGSVHSPNPIVRVWGGVVRNMRFFKLAPEMVICNPFWRLWHFCWMKSKGYR